MKKYLILFILIFIITSPFVLNKISIKSYTNNQDVLKDSKVIQEEKTIDYEKYNIDEMGSIPIMMYHKILDIKKDTYNVDKSGYNRTKDGFISDLEFYYENNYRMIRLIDYVNGDIDTKFGYSPIVLTFDDGSIDNIKVLGKNEDGSLIIDPNSAVGILESFKKKYPDYNVTATFFLNRGLFGQKDYNNDILNWLINNGYDIGNHTYNHLHLDKINSDKIQFEIGSIYNLLDKIIPNKYIKAVALPFGTPYNKNHHNFKYILEGEYDSIKYKTEAALRVGWDSNESPYSKNFDPHFIKRARAYDNFGKDFDIKMVFDLLKNKRYISDGNKNTIVTKDKSNIRENTNKTIILYWQNNIFHYNNSLLLRRERGIHGKWF